MKESLQGKGILAANLRLLADERDARAAKGELMAAEAARMLAEPYVKDADRISRFEGATAEFLPLAGGLAPRERVAFVREMLVCCREAGMPMLPKELLPIREDIPERVSYFRTVYTDEAYDGFAAAMREPTVQYADAFFLSCEDVKGGEAGYCILPCENSDGPLPAMTAIADRYGLFRVGTYRAFHADGENATHFGLFSPALSSLPRAEALLLRFSCVLADEAALSLHLSALAALGLRVLRSEGESPAEGGALSCTFLCGVGQGELTAALLYLRIFAERLVLRGVYEEIG